MKYIEILVYIISFYCIYIFIKMSIIYDNLIHSLCITHSLDTTRYKYDDTYSPRLHSINESIKNRLYLPVPVSLCGIRELIEERIEILKFMDKKKEFEKFMKNDNSLIYNKYLTIKNSIVYESNMDISDYYFKLVNIYDMYKHDIQEFEEEYEVLLDYFYNSINRMVIILNESRYSNIEGKIKDIKNDINMLIDMYVEAS